MTASLVQLHSAEASLVLELAATGAPLWRHLGARLDPGAPNRDNLVFRTGPVVTVSLTDHLQAIGAAAFAIIYHDDLGLSGSDLGQIALRYRWASGEAWPNFP